MSLNPSPLNTSRTGGCTLTGALAVTTGIKDSVTIIHGPSGCAHHNFSLLHATILDNDCMAIPSVMSSAMSEYDVIFGGEEALLKVIIEAASGNPGIIFVLSTCITETIGDDVLAVSRNAGVPVCMVPTGGFLGGDFEMGFSHALIAVSDLVIPMFKPGEYSRTDSHTVNLVGEKNLEYEVKENFLEIKRLVSLLDLTINLRFAHDITRSDIDRLPFASVNILREPALTAVGNHLRAAFGTPFINSFPLGISGTLSFITNVALITGSPLEKALEAEKKYQEEVFEEFSDLQGALVRLKNPSGSQENQLIEEIFYKAGFIESPDGVVLPVPYPFPVGTNGMKRMLHLWRRSLICRAV
jgi:nitrogenase molybdenum-iron protein alpha/beta subunit